MFKILHLVMLLCISYSSFCTNKIPEFTVVFDGKKNAVIINWQHKSPDIKTYIIQRSLDNRTWADIAIQGIAPNTASKTFNYEDKNVETGENYYRLKAVTVNGTIEYSLGIMVITYSPVYRWLMYPVPVKDVLTLEYNGSQQIKGSINVFILNSSGKIMTRVRNSSLSKTIQIPVNHLARGIYDIRIIIEGEIVWNQRIIK